MATGEDAIVKQSEVLRSDLQSPSAGGGRESTMVPRLLSPASSLVVLMLASAVGVLITLPDLTAGGFFWQLLGFNLLGVYTIVVPSLFFLGVLQKHLSDSRFLLAVILVPSGVAALIVYLLWLVEPMGPVANLELQLVTWVGSTAIVSGICSRYLALHGRWKAQVVAEESARLASLQARIQPHFFFNTINTIAEMIATEPQRAEAAILDFSDIVRASFKPGRFHSIAEEIDLIRGYLRIEQARFAGRLSVRWAIADDLPLSSPIPALLLQPIVENALTHGLSRIQGGGELAIELTRAGRDKLVFVVRNPAPPESSEPSAGSSTAVDNIRQRLELAFPGRFASFKLSRVGSNIEARLSLPV